MKRSTEMAGKGQTGRRDLFGKRSRAGSIHDASTQTLALDLRAMSERAFRAGLGRCSSLIEVAALMVELEGAAATQDEFDI